MVLPKLKLAFSRLYYLGYHGRPIRFLKKNSHALTGIGLRRTLVSAICCCSGRGALGGCSFSEFEELGGVLGLNLLVLPTKRGDCGTNGLFSFLSTAENLVCLLASRLSRVLEPGMNCALSRFCSPWSGMLDVYFSVLGVGIIDRIYEITK